jgi:Flp pilus assembly protein TadG
MAWWGPHHPRDGRSVAIPGLRRHSAVWIGLGSCRRGVAAVEFALAVTPLLLIVFGFIAINLMFYTLSVMQNSANYASMSVATNQITKNDNGTISSANASSTGVACATATDASKIEYYACKGLPTWAAFTVTTNLNCASTPPTVTISLSVDATAAGVVDLSAMFGSTMSMFSGKQLTATSVAMKQGSCT